MILIRQVKGYGKKINEDVTYVEEGNTENLFVGVADGQSLKHFSVQGGKLSLLKVAEYFRDRRVEVLKNKYVDEIQYELIHLIRMTYSMWIQKKSYQN